MADLDPEADSAEGSGSEDDEEGEAAGTEHYVSVGYVFFVSFPPGQLTLYAAFSVSDLASHATANPLFAKGRRLLSDQSTAAYASAARLSTIAMTKRCRP